MRILHPFRVVSDVWDEEDGSRHIHAEFEDGALVCVVQRDGEAASIHSNRLVIPVEGTDDVTLGAPAHPQGD